jgi:hypothetical protein
MTTSLTVLAALSACGGVHALLLIALKSEWHVQITLRRSLRHPRPARRPDDRKHDKDDRARPGTVHAVIKSAPAASADARETRH